MAIIVLAEHYAKVCRKGNDERFLGIERYRYLLAIQSISECLLLSLFNACERKEMLG